MGGGDKSFHSHSSALFAVCFAARGRLQKAPGTRSSSCEGQAGQFPAYSHNCSSLGLAFLTGHLSSNPSFPRPLLPVGFRPPH